jgi:hypothetical protein
MVAPPLRCYSFLSLAASVSLFAAESAHAEELNQPPKGFRALFNGKNLDDWRGQIAEDPRDIAKITKVMTPPEVNEMQKKADNKTFEHWTVQEGVIQYDGAPRIGNIETREHFGDFELYVDWKIPKGGDSGVFPRNMPQVQIWDPAGGKRNVAARAGLTTAGRISLRTRKPTTQSASETHSTSRW